MTTTANTAAAFPAIEMMSAAARADAALHDAITTIIRAVHQIALDEGISSQDVLDDIIADNRCLPDHAAPAWSALAAEADMAISDTARWFLGGRLIEGVADMMGCTDAAARNLIRHNVIATLIDRRDASCALREWEEAVRRRRAA